MPIATQKRSAREPVEFYCFKFDARRVYGYTDALARHKPQIHSSPVSAMTFFLLPRRAVVSIIPVPHLATRMPTPAMQFPNLGSFTPNGLDVDIPCSLSLPATGYPHMRTALPIPVTGDPYVTRARRRHGFFTQDGWRRTAGDGDTPADVGIGDNLTRVEKECGRKTADVS